VGTISTNVSVNQSYLDDVTRVCRASRSVPPFLHTMSQPFNRPIEYVWMGSVSAMSMNQSCLGMTSHKHLDWSCSFAHHVGHSIGLCSMCLCAMVSNSVTLRDPMTLRTPAAAARVPTGAITAWVLCWHIIHYLCLLMHHARGKTNKLGSTCSL